MSELDNKRKVNLYKYEGCHEIMFFKCKSKLWKNIQNPFTIN